MSIQISGTSPYRLSSVNWNHPGKTTIVITKVDAVPSGNKEGENRVSNPNVDEYFHVDGIQPQLRNIRMETQNGLRVCYWTYECGITDRLGSPTDRQDKNVQGEQWSMSVDLMEVPIIQHPNGLEICNAHGGIIKGGEIVFSRYVNGVKNPWYGTSGFYFPTVNLEVQCVMEAGEVKRGSVEFTQVNKVGRNDAGLQSPKGHNCGFSFISESAWKTRKPWLLTGNTVRRAGKESQETKSWKWGGKVGWLDAIYDPDWSGTGSKGGGGLSGGGSSGATTAGLGVK